MKKKGLAALVVIIILMVGAFYYIQSPSSNYRLLITVVPSGSGTVSISPPGSSFPPDTVVTLTAYASSGGEFVGWSGSVTSTQNPLTVTMNSPKSITATFAGGSVQYEQLNTLEGAGGPYQSFPNPTTLQFTDVPRSSSSFLRKEGMWNTFDLSFHLKIPSYTPTPCIDYSAGLVGVGLTRSLVSTSVKTMQTNSDGFNLYFRQYTGVGTRIEPSQYTVVSSCGSGLQEALHGTGMWVCNENQVHTAIIDLGASYNHVSYMTARSCTSSDPKTVNIYVSQDGVNWDSSPQGTSTDRFNNQCVGLGGGMALCICGETTPIAGRYVKLEVTTTENANNALAWGVSPADWIIRFWHYETTPPYSLLVRANNFASASISPDYGLEFNTDYYIRIYKSVDGTITTNIYGDIAQQNLLRTIALPGSDFADYTYFLPFLCRGEPGSVEGTVTGTLDSFRFT